MITVKNFEAGVFNSLEKKEFIPGDLYYKVNREHKDPILIIAREVPELLYKQILHIVPQAVIVHHQL